MEHNNLFPDHLCGGGGFVIGFGTLLGPEKTAVPPVGGWVLFSGRRPDRPSNASACGCGGGCVVGVCGCVLSVA